MTVLKIGFAMGGGIALGTFNGSVLGEAIKLARLRGMDSNGERFDKVEVDVFSGASAGSMSLGLMLRALAHQTDAQITSAERNLEKQYGEEYTSIDDEDLKSDLIAAQVLQDIQYEAWVKEVSMERLLQKNKKGPRDKRLKNTAGILNRAAVDAIAQKYFQFEPAILENDSMFTRRKILADRVLYASALTNLTPIINDARTELPVAEGGHAVLADGMTSKTHRELRVFDLYFGVHDASYFSDEEKHPARWVRYHLGDKIDNTVGQLAGRDGEAWAKMAATAVASGAFPFAFEPVVLKRRDYEYGEDLWPKEFSEKNIDAANFTYSDGGTFNNEPIREAFRMAAFIDAHDVREKTERRIIFVDPYVSDVATTYKVPVHQKFNLESPTFGNLDGYDLEPRHSLDRLIPQAFSILNAISNQSRLIEGDKVYQARKKFLLRDQLRPVLTSALSAEPTIDVLKSLANNIKETLENNRKKMMIPTGTLTIEGELSRIIKEIESLSALEGKETEFINAIDNDGPLTDKGVWLQALSHILLDLTLDLSGKNKNAKLISIGPVRNPSSDNSVEPIRIALPGEKLGAFGGFMHERARHVDTEIGKWCAKKFLEVAGLIESSSDESIPEMSVEEEKEYTIALERGTEQLINRIFSMISNGHVPFLSAIPKPLLSLFLKSKILNTVLHPETGSIYEFRIKLPDDSYKDFEWDGPGSISGDQDIKPVALDDGHYLVTYAKFNNGVWSGAHVSSQCLKVDKDGLFVDTTFCHIKLPSENMLKDADILGYPIFQSKIDISDKGATLPSNKWNIINLASPLYEELLN